MVNVCKLKEGWNYFPNGNKILWWDITNIGFSPTKIYSKKEIIKEIENQCGKIRIQQIKTQRNK